MLLFKIYSAYPLAYASQDFVGDGPGPASDLGNGKPRSENHNFVTFFHPFYSSDIQHAHVHGNGADGGRQPAADEHPAHAVAEPPRISIRVAYADGCNSGRMVDMAPAVVARGLPGFQVVQLGDVCF